MDTQILRAYHSLVPTDQLVIDAMIAALATKDKRINEMVREVQNLLDRQETNDGTTERG